MSGMKCSSWSGEGDCPLCADIAGLRLDTPRIAPVPEPIDSVGRTPEGWAIYDEASDVDWPKLLNQQRPGRVVLIRNSPPPAIPVPASSGEPPGEFPPAHMSLAGAQAWYRAKIADSGEPATWVSEVRWGTHDVAYPENRCRACGMSHRQWARSGEPPCWPAHAAKAPAKPAQRFSSHAAALGCSDACFVCSEPATAFVPIAGHGTCNAHRRQMDGWTPVARATLKLPDRGPLLGAWR